MTVLNPTSIKGDAQAKLAQMVAGSATFQSECGQTDPDQIVGRFVQYPHMRAQDQVPIPFAVIRVPDGGLSYYRVAGGDKTYFLSRGSLLLSLGRALKSMESTIEEELLFTNWEEAVLSDLIALAGVSDNLNITDVSMTKSAARSDPRNVSEQAQKPYYAVEYRLEWDAQ